MSTRGGASQKLFQAKIRPDSGTSASGGMTRGECAMGSVFRSPSGAAHVECLDNHNICDVVTQTVSALSVERHLQMQWQVELSFA